VSLVKTLQFGGHDDWRLPTIQELSSIVDCENIEPAVNADSKSGYFLNMQLAADGDDTTHGYYWSSTPVAAGADAGNMFYVNFTDGSIGSDSTDIKNYAIAVRGDTAASSADRFQVYGDTVVDTLSGLMWQKTSAFTGNWEDALVYCENTDFDGYEDWRMPNRKELQSLIDYAKSAAPVAYSAFTVAAESYWTSTTYAKDPTTAWAVNFENGYIGSKGKVTESKVLAVRGGQNEIDEDVISEPKQTSAWMMGRVMPIVWNWGTPSSPKDNVDIFVSQDAGKTWAAIVKETPNDSTYIWWEIGK
jgi:hypothetical protein